MAMTVLGKSGIEDRRVAFEVAPLPSVSCLFNSLMGGEGGPPRESSSDLPLREGVGCRVGAGSGGQVVGNSKIVFVMYFARIGVGGGMGESDMSSSENAEPKCPVLGSTGHKNAEFGGLPFII